MLHSGWLLKNKLECFHVESTFSLVYYFRVSLKVEYNTDLFASMEQNWKKIFAKKHSSLFRRGVNGEEKKISEIGTG